MSEVIAFFLGIVSLSTGVYLRRAFKESSDRRKIAIRLEAYLLRGLSQIRDSENMLSFFALGEKWRKEQLEASARGYGAFEDEIERQENKMEDLKREIVEDKKHIEALEELRKLKDFEVKQKIEMLSEQKKLLIENKTYISDQEAGKLPWRTAQLALRVKMEMISLIDTWISLLKYVRSEEEIDEDEVKGKLFSFIENIIELTQRYMPLFEDVKEISQKSTIRILLNWK